MEDVLLVPQQKGETNKKEPKQLFFWLFLVCLFGLSAILISNTRMIQAALIAWGQVDTTARKINKEILRGRGYF
jgi:hypothetical protein